MTDRSEQARQDRLQATSAKGRELLPLQGAAIQALFELRETQLINRMITANPGDDESRRSAALELRALRDLRSWIASTVRAGSAATDRLEKQNAE